MPALLNIVLFGVEATAYFAVMAMLFRGRRRYGIGLFFCALGAMHFLETYLAAVFYVALPWGLLASPGSVILFSGKLVMLLLVYIREDAATVRQPVYGLLFANLLMVGLAWLMRLHVMAPEVAMPAADFRFMDEMGGLMIWGTTLLFIDAILIVLLYEYLGRWLSGRMALRIVASASFISLRSALSRRRAARRAAAGSTIARNSNKLRTNSRSGSAAKAQLLASCSGVRGNGACSMLMAESRRWMTSPMTLCCGSSGIPGCPRQVVTSRVGMRNGASSDVSGLTALPSPEFWQSTTVCRPASHAPAAIAIASPSLAAPT